MAICVKQKDSSNYLCKINTLSLCTMYKIDDSTQSVLGHKNLCQIYLEIFSMAEFFIFSHIGIVKYVWYSKFKF